MAQTASEYARRLVALQIPPQEMQRAGAVFETDAALFAQLCAPTVKFENKKAMIDRAFSPAMRDFVLSLCENRDIEKWAQIVAQYEALADEQKGYLRAGLTYATPPTEEQLTGLRLFIREKYGYPEEKILFHHEEDKALVSGFVLTVGRDEYDWSAAGRVEQFRVKIENAALSGTEPSIISLLKAEISDFALEAQTREIGTVCTVDGGIITIEGLESVAYGEIVAFETGTKGMVQDIRRDRIGCILFGADGEILEGSRVVRTGKKAGVAVSGELLGHVVDALGAPIDGLGPIRARNYRPIEHKAPGVIRREEVNVPLQTGILAIDAMFPIGRGQRELIIGDRKTGKTALAIDAILNQKNRDVICIYVSIGQKTSSTAQIVQTLKKHGAMPYSIVVAASASDSASLQYIAPYTGAAIGEYFMDEGRDVLIVFDDLSKHAQAYRSISLLLQHPPGREAYPGDIFYLHSRLLERACRRNAEAGGGSMTALPIIETQGNDVSAYIPTNVISITDGQIFLETELFHAGQRPAINVGLSVSRVGGKAQAPVMKAVSGKLRIDLAQYREMESFTQFSADLDDSTKNLLVYGKSLFQLITQPPYKPMSLHQEVILLLAASDRLLLDIPADRMEDFKQEMVSFVEKTAPALVNEMESGGKMTAELNRGILDAVRAFKRR